MMHSERPNWLNHPPKVLCYFQYYYASCYSLDITLTVCIHLSACSISSPLSYSFHFKPIINFSTIICYALLVDKFVSSLELLIWQMKLKAMRILREQSLINCMVLLTMHKPIWESEQVIQLR